MCKQNQRLIFIALFLLAVTILTAPMEKPCNHDYYYSNCYSNDGCETLICRDCHLQFKNDHGHSFKQIDCYTKQCIWCGQIKEDIFHRNRCDRVGECIDCGSDVPQQGNSHVWDSIRKDCKEIYVCKLCRETQLAREKHVWTGKDCTESVWCGECGEPNPDITKHWLLSPFGGIVTYCVRCEYAEFLAHPVDRFLLAAMLLGVLWIVLAFAFCIRERRRFSLDRRLLRRARLDIGESGADHCPHTRLHLD